MFQRNLFRYDLMGRPRLTYCKRGHDLSVTRIISGGTYGCRACNAERVRIERKQNPKRFARYRRAKGLRDNYGISLEKYQEIFEAQNGVCAICHRQPNPNKSLAVDHDHETGVVRGLLCDNCNLMLGLSKDSPLILEAAIRYLQ